MTKKYFLFLPLLFILVAADACKKSDEKSVHSSGQVTIRSTFACDLDEGVETGDSTTVDFEWTNQPPHIIEPVNGAKFHLTGTNDLDSLEYSTLTGYTYSTSNIPESQLPLGTVVAAITNQGRYCKFRIDANDPHLTITWVTYEL
jgi:hypothetical protein